MMTPTQNFPSRPSLLAVFFLAIFCLATWGCSDEESQPVVPVPTEDPGLISLDRSSWLWASAPSTTFSPEDRVEHVRWFAPRERTLRWYLNPNLDGDTRDDTVPTMDLYLRSDNDAWEPENWGGVTRGLRSHDRPGLDLSGMVKLDIWVNDGHPDPADRSGRLHIDFGYISEDGFWPEDGDGEIQIGTWQMEDGILDGNPDGVFFAPDEDIGLDGFENGPQRFDSSYEINGDNPFPRINGTARNAREDSEDLDGNDRLDIAEGYFTVVIDLKETPADVDVVQDFEDVQELIDNGISWRKYSFDLDLSDVVEREVLPDLSDLHQIRIWFEDDQMPLHTEVQLQISEPWFR